MRLTAALPLLLWSTGAAALSCLPHDVARVYQEAAASEDRYTVVLGEITFDPALLPEIVEDDPVSTPRDTRIPARITGRALSHGGFLHPHDSEIDLVLKCFGPWCARAQSGTRFLAFVNLDRQPPEVVLDPCGGTGFGRPTAAMEQQAVACFTGGDCSPAAWE